MNSDQIDNSKPEPRKLFGIKNPLLKAIFLIAFVLLTGGLGLIVILLAYAGDRATSKRKKKRS